MFKKVIILIVLLLAQRVSDGQVVFRSVEDIWKYADTHNINIKTIKYELDKSTYSKRQAYSALLPQANATASYTDNIQLPVTILPAGIIPGVPGGPVSFGSQYAYVAGANAQMNILNLQNFYNARMAAQTEDMNKDSLASTRKYVYQQIATQYYSYLLMQEAARLADETVKAADSVATSVNNKYKEGTLNEANTDIAKINLARAQQTQISAQYQMRTARNNLKALLGLSVSDSLNIDASMPANFNIEPTGTFSEDPSLRLALWRTKLSLTQYRMTNSAFAPSINVLYNYTGQRYDKKFEPFSGATGAAGWYPAQYWSLQASIPLFSSGGRLFQSKRSKLNYEESMEQYDYAQKQSAINDENIRLNYQKAIAVLSKTQEVMKLSFNNYTHISNRYEAGIVSLDERLNAFKDYIDYQNHYLNSLSDMLVQLYQVKIRQQSF
ncbi:MAG: TolC family protein [Flavipsychrobacter sp.]|nr:TolC family protein [Flavipsychrobacter sp.]